MDADKQYSRCDNNNQYQILFSSAAEQCLFPFMSHIFITNRSFLIYGNWMENEFYSVWIISEDERWAQTLLEVKDFNLNWIMWLTYNAIRHNNIWCRPRISLSCIYLYKNEKEIVYELGGISKDDILKFDLD